MATLTIRNLPDDVYTRLRVRAAQNGRSMEAEVRHLLSSALTPEGSDTLPKRSDNSSAENALAEQPSTWRAEDTANSDADKKRKTALESLRKMMANVKAKDGGSLVDEFLAERRAMWGEE